MLRITLCCLALATTVSGASAATHRVPSEYPTIQAGIDACASGDTVLVAAGTYSGQGNIELKFNGLQCTLVGESGPALTIIDCNGAGKGINLRSDGASTAEVVGFTIREAAYVSGEGGAVSARDDDLIFVDVHFMDKSSTFGGGINVASGRLVVRNCQFERNHAEWDGGALGAILGAVVLVQDCQFLDNSAGAAGGAIYGNGADSLLVRNCLLQGNRGGAIGGGAISAASHAGFEGLIFIANEAIDDGGAMLLAGSDHSTSVRDCIFIGNHASGGSGGAICMGVGFEPAGHAIIEGCLFTGNTASFGGGGIGMGNYSAPTIKSCTFVGNSADVVGGAIFMHWYSTPTIEQVLVTGNLANGGISVDGVSAPIVSCCDLWGNAGGNYVGNNDPIGTNGNISADPRFCGAQPDDFTLQANSPCAPANNSCGTLIGLYGVDCDSVAVQRESWGGIKSRY